jgi:putative inorganic carbon (HCO3(-)) transporter
MSYLAVEKKFLLPVFLAFGSLAVGILEGVELPAMMAILSAVLLVSLTLYSLELALYTLFFTRPSLDVFSNFSFRVYEGLEINIAAIVALYGMSLSALLILKYWSRVTSKRVPLLGVVGLYWLVSLVYVPINEVLLIGINEIIRISSFILMYLVMFLIIESKKDYYRYIQVVCISAVIPALMGVLELISGTGLYSNPGFENRIAGTFGHPNVFGYYLMMVIALIVTTVIYQTGKANKNFTYVWALAGIYGFLLIQTFTRGAWIGLCMIVYLLVLVTFTRKTLKWSIISMVATLIFAGSYISVNQIDGVNLPSLASNSLVKRVTGLFSEDPSDSVIWRRNIWADMFATGQQRPLSGHGTGSIEYVTEQVRGLDLGALEVHNDYIKVFVEMGWIGLVVYILLIAGMLVYFFALYQDTKNIYVLVVLNIILAVYFSSFYDNLLRQTANMWIFFGLVGATIRYGLIERELLEREKVQPRIRSGRMYDGGERADDIDLNMPKPKL